MFVATDESGKRIDAGYAEKGGTYFCPICHSPLTIKAGKINAKHFAHQSSPCRDRWNYDMSEWHRQMQNYFDIDTREVIICDGQKVHRADVMVNDIVIEFQHSPISADEFMERNTFFRKIGKRIVWVFDVSRQFNNKSLYFSDYDDRLLLVWKKPFRIFSKSVAIADDVKDYAIWLFWKTEDDNDVELHKVIWTETDDDGHPNFKRMLISNHSIQLSQNKDINVEYFFYTESDYLRDAIVDLKQKHTFNVKYIGEARKARSAYICPRRPSEFGIKIFSEKGCYYCRYCYMIAKKELWNRSKWAVYCCYPKQVQELTEWATDYECSGADIYDI